jgi:general secretion pathway protein F
MTAAGKSTRGHLDAENLRTARSKLRRDGIFPTEIGEASGKIEARATSSGKQFSLPSFSRVSALDLALVTRQAATLLGAGIPLVEALGALTEQSEHPRLKSVLGQIRDRVNEGASLADALGQSTVFPDLYVSMVRAGEAGGALDQVLGRLADYLENQVRLRNKVSSILIYPTVMFCFAIYHSSVLQPAGS